MAASASSSPISTSQKYDVFLSFRGEDTRNGITSHIYSALTKKKIETYMDDKSLERGHEISPALLEAIERSKISVVILSEDYASSSWCLSELVHILKCRNERGQVVLPIFYEVHPSHVRKQEQGSYRNAFKEHEKKFKDKSETVREWRLALKASADIAGIHYSKSSSPESKLVEEVVEVIMKELSRPVIPDDDFKGLVGMQEHYRKIESLLSIYSSRVRILSIWGMGGIGKTTIADAVFTRLSKQFESSYFLKNVREESEKYGLENLRNEIIAKLLGDEKLNSESLPNRILEHTKDRLRRTKTLLVLDDVSEKKQLESLVSDLFGRDSRIIVTTRDEGVCRGTTILADFEKYEVEQLSIEESLQLFNLKTFGENSAPTDYQELSDKVVRYAGCNPLAITVLGSHLRSLRNPTKENWEMELEKLKVVPHDDIIKLLQISYDGLDKTKQKLFLDIACFFKRWQRGFVENILNACKLFASTGIDILIDKSLITVDSHDNILDMHDLVQQMGWHIVREESEEPGERSRIWTVEDASDVLSGDMGASQIEGIFLDISELDKDVYLKPTFCQRMNKLRLLRIYHSQDNTKKYQVHIEALDCLPESLRYLEWYGYPLKSLPSKFDPRNLVEIKMPYSQLEHLWHGRMNLDKLKGIDVRNSVNLTQTPDLSCAQNLETINLENCTSLLEVPWHILQNLNKLLDVNLSNCQKVESFPDRMDARGLKTLNLSGCLNLKTVPDIISGNLVSLDLSSTAIVNVPSSIGSIKTLSEFNLIHCRHLKSLPSSIRQLKSLETLRLFGCYSLEKFPELPMNINNLFLSGTGIKEVPASFIENRSCLHSINISDCKTFESLPSNIFELPSLTSLDLSGCSNLENLPDTSSHVESNLEFLYLDGTGIRRLPSSIGNLNNVGNTSSLSLSSLQSLFLKNCKRLQCIPHLPLSLRSLDATGCSSLDLVFDLTLNEFKKRFWDQSGYEIFASLVFSECLRLDQRAVDNIVTIFQLKALRMATKYVSARYFQDIISPAIATCYSGEEIPNWFENVCHCSDDRSGSVTIPLPAKCPSGDMLGFALCAVVAVKSFTLGADIFCEIKLISDGLLGDMMNYPYNGPFAALFGFPVSDSNQVVMWYNHLDFDNLYRSDAKEVSFEFKIKERPNDPSYAKLIKCGVHVLSKSDLDELGVSDHNYRRRNQIDHQEYDDSSVSSTSSISAPPETSLALEIVESDTHVETHDPVNNTLIHEHSNSALWHILLSAWSALLLCCSRETDRSTHDDEKVLEQMTHDVDALR